MCSWMTAFLGLEVQEGLSIHYDELYQVDQGCSYKNRDQNHEKWPEKPLKNWNPDKHYQQDSLRWFPNLFD